MCSTTTYVLKYNDEMKFKIFGVPYAMHPVICLRFVFTFKHWRAPRTSWKNILTVLESPGIFVSKSVGPWTSFLRMQHQISTV